jgi:hypothetical protein
VARARGRRARDRRPPRGYRLADFGDLQPARRGRKRLDRDRPGRRRDGRDHHTGPERNPDDRDDTIDERDHHGPDHDADGTSGDDSGRVDESNADDAIVADTVTDRHSHHVVDTDRYADGHRNANSNPHASANPDSHRYANADPDSHGNFDAH